MTDDRARNCAIAAGPLTRRSALASAGFLAVAMGAGAAKAALQRPRRPNFLFIMADDLGYADLSCFGRRDYETPHLDRLAGQGVKLTSAYANSAVCTPTRVALITGQYQYRFPIGLQEPLVTADVGLEPGVRTMASALRKSGYHTSLVGKWHMGALPRYGPLKSGYDEFWGIREGGVDYFTHGVFDRNDLWDGTTNIEMQGHLTGLLADRAIAGLESRATSDRPWLMSLHLTAPHWPWEGPADQAESERHDRKGGLAILHYDGGTLATYGAMVTDMDRQIGRVLAALEANGQAEDTVVVFTSDNGGERFSDTWPFTGKKGELLEGGIRVPAIVRWPGVTQAGSENATPVMSMDWMPTFLAAAGAVQEADGLYDGIDITPLLRGSDLAPRALFWRHKRLDQAAVRSGRWKYLRIGGNEFLFDVVEDPLERANRRERDSETFLALRDAFIRWNAAMPSDPDAESHGFSARQLADHFGVAD